MSNPAEKPYQMVPASSVVKARTSTPLVVSVGAVPPAQSTVPGHATVWEPPLVRYKVNEHDLPVAEGSENVKKK